MKKLLILITLVGSLFSASFYLEPHKSAFMRITRGNAFVLFKTYVSTEQTKRNFCKTELDNVIFVVPTGDTFRMDIYSKDSTDCSEFYH